MVGLIILALFLVFASVLVIRTKLAGEKDAIYTPSEDTERIDLYARKLSKMIQYETVSYRDRPDPEKFRGFHKLLAELFPNVFANLEKIEIDGNLMMKWQGTDSSLDPIILISHQDVVPAEGDWTHGPFSGDICDGKIYGRGSTDIKNGVFSFYQAVEELISQGYRPKCDVYLGSSCTEEIGGDGAPKMCNYFKERNIRLFMLCDEGGCIIEDPIAGVKGSFAAVGVFEKGYGDIRFTAKSHGGHASTPPKNTPIVRLAKLETEIEKSSPFKVQFCPAVDRMFHDLAPYCKSFGMKLVMANLDILKPLVKVLLPKISVEAAAMLQTTMAFTMQKGADGYNIIPQEAWVTANMRYIPHQGLEESNRIVSEIAAKYDVQTTFLMGNDATTPMDLNGKPYAITDSCIKKTFPGLGIMPYVVTGGTDSRFFNSICDSCVRFSPSAITKDQLGRMHGVDENINANVLPGAVDYYKNLIQLQETR